MTRSEEMHQALRDRYGDRSFCLEGAAEAFWPGQAWCKVATGGGGPRRGARVAGGHCARLAKKGLLRLVGFRPIEYVALPAPKLK